MIELHFTPKAQTGENSTMMSIASNGNKSEGEVNSLFYALFGDAFAQTDITSEEAGASDEDILAEAILRLKDMIANQNIGENTDENAQDAEAAQTIDINADPLEGLQDPPSLQDILALLNNPDTAKEAGIIISNMTPEQLTAFQQSEELDDATAALVSNLITFVKPLPKNMEKLDDSVILALKKFTTEAEGNTKNEEIIAEVNALLSQAPLEKKQLIADVFSKDFKGEMHSKHSSDKAGDYNPLSRLNAGKVNDNGEEAAQNGRNGNGSQSPALAGAMANNAAIAGGLSGEIELPFGDEFLTALSYKDPVSENLTAASGAKNALNSIANATANITQAASAQSPHPGTQIIAQAMRNNAANGQNKTLRIQMEPPELGRVEVKMTFSKDSNAMKTVLTVEKPETYLMLQRDAQTLERALQDAGVDTESGIEFELSEHGFDFDQNNERGGGHDQGGTGAGSEEETEIIDATMTWHVDPATGHMRYNILA